MAERQITRVGGRRATVAAAYGSCQKEDRVLPIETMAKPVRNRISIKVPREYASYSFQVLLVPVPPQKTKWRTIGKVDGLSFKISDEDLFSDDTAEWEACGDGVSVA